MAYDKTTIFQNIGKGVKKFNKIDTPESGFKAVLDSVMSEIVSLYNDSEAERRILNLFSNANRSDQATLDSIKSQTVSIVSSFLTTVVREGLSVVGSTSATVIDALIDAMEDNSDTVKENTVAVSGPTADNDNAGNGTMHPPGYGQQSRDNNDIEVTCIDATTEGAEHWSVVCSKLGSLGTAVSGTTFENESAGISFLIEAQEEISEINDNNNQLDNWSFTGEEKGVNTDSGGKVYVSLTDSAGTRTVSIYKDSGRTQLVAQGQRSGDGEVTLDEQNSSGLSGTVDVTYTQDDIDIYLILPFVFEIGDKFYFSTSISAQGLFQYFFVERFGKALPSDESGEETVSESWAQ
jgi:hypothetical protein